MLDYTALEALYTQEAEQAHEQLSQLGLTLREQLELRARAEEYEALARRCRMSRTSRK